MTVETKPAYDAFVKSWEKLPDVLGSALHSWACVVVMALWGCLSPDAYVIQCARAV
jgi:hypothetical protein